MLIPSRCCLLVLKELIAMEKVKLDASDERKLQVVSVLLYIVVKFIASTVALIDHCSTVLCNHRGLAY